jgi:Tol biopolymer transport system component
LPTSDPRTRWQQWAYSPDGTRIAYPDGGQDGGLSGTRIAVAAADGSSRKVLVATRGGDPRWSPTGDRIAFVGSGSSGRDELGLVDVASGTVVTLAVASGKAESIGLSGFSASGDEVLFSRSDTDLNTLSLWSVGTDGSEPRLLVAGTDSGEWRPAS